MLSFSIVINTLNRAALLRKTLESFRWLKYPGEFEVIVVNGPSTDDTERVIEEWEGKIRAGRCDAANLSMSRNVGICMAKGDVVAFIDDDAVPEPEWIAQLAEGYDSPEIGGAGGLVFDQTGYSYQYEYSTATRLANANWKATASAEHLCFPGSFEFPYLQGTNASFRRSALLEIGGFDEEIEYYLDETDVCCRLIDAGFIIRQLPNAYVHHKFAPSHLRDENRINRHRYPVIKNKIYFSLRHGRPYMPLHEIMQDNVEFTRGREQDLEFHIGGGRLHPSERELFEDESRRAWQRGMDAGLSDRPELIDEAKLARNEGDFRAFDTIAQDHPLTVLLVSKDYPPTHSGGIAVFMHALAISLARQGHIVHVITRSHDINRVDLEDGVWVHRMLVKSSVCLHRASIGPIPHHVWDWSATAFKEAQRIASHRPIDVVEAPVWDCEGVAFLCDGEWPLVTSLQTTLHFWMRSHPHFAADERWMTDFGAPMLALEKRLMTQSDGIRAISEAIRLHVEDAYGFRFDPERVMVSPLGLGEAREVDRRRTTDALTVLFVGRLEERKGIDVLLEAIPMVLEAEPNTRFRIAGDDTLVSGQGDTHRERFERSQEGRRHADRVEFLGRLDDQALHAAYATCDLFVAPSRFESFGLVFLEAMREGKPVIGCDAGGMPEVIRAGETGLLVPPGDAAALAAGIIRLIRSPKERVAMGERGREWFRERFTADAMATASRNLYERAIANERDARR